MNPIIYWFWFYFCFPEDEGSPLQPTIPVITNNQSTTDDVNIHVHKEGGLGGGICAKLVFFVLLSALAVLIGLIITEHRGLTDGK